MGIPHHSPFARRCRPSRVRWIAALAAVVAGSSLPAAAVAPAAAQPAGLRPATGAERLTVVRKNPRPRTVHRLASKLRGRSAAPPLVFGIYPGGGAGTVGPAGRTLSEVAELRSAALRQLRGTAGRFVLHLYDAFTGPADAQAVPAVLAGQIADYAADGFQVELVLRYRPADPAGDVAGFAAFVRERVRQLGRIPAVTSLQVANEVNVAGAPDAADGAYPGAARALVEGLIAAHAAAREAGAAQLRIGFNWAHQDGPGEAALFRQLGVAGGEALATAVDWVGIDAYPGTWGPPIGRTTARSVRRATIRAMRTLRRDLLPLAGLRDAAIHFSESGYPTGDGRSEATQRAVMRAAIGAVSRARAAYGVTDYRWFDLRDADSAGPGFESRYGLMRDDYAPKPAFFAYRDLIAKLG